MTASAASLLALAASVEAGEGPDREMDARVLVALGILEPNPDAICSPERSFKRGQYVVWLLSNWRITEWPILHEVEPVTASVDAALALMADVLPGYVCTSSTYGFASRMPIADVYREGHEGRAQSKASTLPRAITAAVLRAWRERGDA